MFALLMPRASVEDVRHDLSRHLLLRLVGIGVEPFLQARLALPAKEQQKPDHGSETLWSLTP